MRTHDSKARRVLHRVTVAVFGALAIAAGALGQELRLGGEFQVNAYTSAAQRYASVAADAAGGFVVVWASAGQDGAEGGVFGHRFSSSGAPIAVEFQVNTYTGTNQAYPAVATSASGDFVVVWDSYAQDGSVYGIFARLFSSVGVAVGADFQINSRTSSSQSRPAVAREASGAFVVTWSSSAQDGQGFGIFARRLSSTGGVFGVEFQVNTHTITDQFMPAIALDLDGDFVVAWQSSFQDGSGDGVFARRFSSAGAPLGVELQVNLYTDDTQQLPTVAMDSDGDFVVAWQSQGQDGSSYGVFVRRFSSAGAAVTSEIPVNVHTTSTQAYPAVSDAADGDFVVVWQSNNQDGLLYSVFGRRFTSAGIALTTTEFAVNTYTSGVQIIPAIASDGTGRGVVAWQSLLQDGSDYGIFAQRFGAQITGDIDGNGVTDPLTDGLLFLRYLFGFRGATLITGAVGASCTRCDAPSIEAYLANLAA